MHKTADLGELRLNLDTSTTIRVLARLDNPNILAVLLLLTFALFILIVRFETAILWISRARLDVERQRQSVKYMLTTHVFLARVVG